MTHVSEQLRQRGDSLSLKAADKIEKLREENVRLRAIETQIHQANSAKVRSSRHADHSRVSRSTEEDA